MKSLWILWGAVLACFVLSSHAYVGRIEPEELITILQDTACTYSTYDLNPLSAATDYQGTSTEGNGYYINFCKNAVIDCVGNGADTDGPVCQHDTGGNYHGCGTLDSFQWVEQPLYGVDIIFSGGDSCHSGAFNRETHFQLYCDPSVTGAVINSVEADPGESCRYFISVNTSRACGGAPPVPPPQDKFNLWLPGPGIFLFFISIIVVIMYIIIGILVQAFAFKRRGLEMIPNRTFWTLYFVGLRDGTVFTFLRLKDFLIFLGKKIRLLIDLIKGKLGKKNQYESFT